MINFEELYLKRNKFIYEMFVLKYRQKHIASITGLSESRVKKIIGEMKKWHEQNKKALPEGKKEG